MDTLRKSVIIAGFAVCGMSIATFILGEFNTRLAFDNTGYPPNIGVELWVDDVFKDKVTRATCTIDHCETAPMVITKGRHRIRLRVLVADQFSAFTETTIER
jgi:hypothetical protein